MREFDDSPHVRSQFARKGKKDSEESKIVKAFFVDRKLIKIRSNQCQHNDLFANELSELFESQKSPLQLG